MILLYHKVSKLHKTKWYVTDHTFYRQMLALKEHGMKVVPLKEYDPRNKKHVAITFDGGYDEMFDVAVPILKSFGFEYDIFVIGDYVGKDNRFDSVEPLENFLSVEHLKEMVEVDGAHLQWHTNSHKKISDVNSREAWIEELTIPSWIKDLDPSGFRFFAYPYGGNASWQYDEVKKRFDGALFVRGGSDVDIYRLNRVLVFENTDFKMLLAGRCGRLALRIVRSIKEGRFFMSVSRRMYSLFQRGRDR